MTTAIKPAPLYATATLSFKNRLFAKGQEIKGSDKLPLDISKSDRENLLKTEKATETKPS